MDFSYLLDLAKQNEEQAKEAVQVKRYSTQVSASKKIPRSGVQSDGIRAFLARKDHEEKQKRMEEKKKKEVLLSLRAQDRKSNARVQAMLKRTKSGNKAVLDEAKNSLNTAVTAAGLDVQPDEDDYGYVSHEASAAYKKLIDKYSSTDTSNSNTQRGRTHKELRNAKDRVKNALDKIEEAEGTPHRKKRINKPIMSKEKVDELLKVDNKTRNNDRDVPKKVRPKGLPPEASLSFDQILKLAAAKQHEPINLEKKLDIPEKKEPESNRLMTKKEKEDLMRRKEEERDRQLRKEGKLPPIRPTPDNSAVPALPAKSKEKPPTKVIPSKEPVKTPSFMNGKILNSTPNTSSINKPVMRADNQKSTVAKPNIGQRPGVSKVIQNKPGPPQIKGPPPKTLPPPQLSRVPQGKGKTLAKPPAGPSRPFPPYRDIRPVDRGYKRSMESDEEEDSELDDFIDDGPDEAEDYSKHIQDIFGYNRNRYRIESDDEDECMESSFAQQMKEECISTKIGILEDLEQERLLREEEEEERKRKAASAKRAKSRK
ncbi:hypothetical protein DAPPUDRAFT_300972 [Daphnia pulex]|uniref:Protein SPT2 homolog n=1 Tax=Daphnia pulex TaxID=6669 RepID=E9HFT2_DAPPU|nr:hypothetical protein DAPPUDRAFT_300972 [Daphnia pulex]|eukprot:EFX69414.1 hypothetical protein DAPPUDRAFT_300972 [Daphnia pulex]